MEGKIYRITGGGMTYYGSTTRELKARFNEHRTKFSAYKKGKGNFVSSFKVLEHDDAKIELVEDVLYNKKYELALREKFFISNYDCVNINMPTGIDCELFNKSLIL
jgi:hypothetical protein